MEGREGEPELEMRSGGARGLLDLRPGSSISLAYHSQFGAHDELLLLEADSSILPDILHNRVCIRGLPNEEAVLCSPSSTFCMKSVGTSNSVLLIPAANSSCWNAEKSCIGSDLSTTNLSFPSEAASIFKISPGNMELVRVAPRLDKLKMLLGKRPYNPDDDDPDMIMEEENNCNMYKWDDLVNLIQASDEELMNGLRALSALEVNGFWRVLDIKVVDDTLRMILRYCIIKDWPIDGIREDELLSVLKADNISCKFALHCLSTYGSRDESDGICIWSLNKKKVCIHFATQILKVGKMKLENFREKWIHSIPPGITADLQLLEGEVLYERIGLESWIYSFSVSKLPLDPAQRFAVLFQERPKWEGKDLLPFIRDLKVPGVSLEGLLIKYARRTQPTEDAEPIFSARNLS